MYSLQKVKVRKKVNVLIISASRRTDIPAFYSDWFFNRLQAGFVLVRNPMNPKQISKINLSSEIVDCIVFWTKNPAPMINRLNLLQKYNYYFQFTLTSYDKTIEMGVPKKSEVINTFIELSRKIGSNRVIWRYDPILLTNTFNKDYHYKYFEFIARKLYGYTNRCVISFIDLYTKTKRNTKALNLLTINDVDIYDISSKLVAIAAKYDIKLETCSEKADLSSIGIGHSKCIDDSLISEILGVKLNIEKDKNQREICGCVTSSDIGAYNTCKHHCLYCYANFSDKTVIKNFEFHNPDSPLLLGEIEPNDVIKEREVKSYISKQTDIFSSLKE
jgi:DNA repair photolyase